jgi:hypothetical protein
MATTAQRIHAERFRYGTPRSDAYKAGFCAALRKRLEGVSVVQPFEWGTAHADAFSSGVDHGYAHLDFLAMQAESASQEVAS